MTARPLDAPVVGVVLAGGASRRMGRDKTRLRLGSMSLVERASEVLHEVTDEVLVADRGVGLVPGCRSIADGPGAGPAAGILGAAAERPDHDLLVLACDLPEIPSALLRHLVVPIEEDAHVPRWRRGPEPLCALYRPAALAAMLEQVQAGRLALYAMLKRLNVRYLEGSTLGPFGPPEQLFLNLNTPADLESLSQSSVSS